MTDTDDRQMPGIIETLSAVLFIKISVDLSHDDTTSVIPVFRKLRQEDEGFQPVYAT